METRANYVIVGLFTVVAILAAFGFVYWTAGVGGRTDTAPIQFRIPGSAAGLGTGSAVLFNGVRVGTVERVHIDPTNPRVAVAEARVDRSTPITESTKADVGLASLTTGQANIELRGGDPDEPNLLERAEEQGTVAEVTANPSAVSDLLQSAQSLLARADSVMGQLEGFVSDARGPLTETAKNAQAFSEALARNADGVDKFLESVSALSETLTGVSDRLDSTLASAEDLLNSVDREKVASSLANIERFTSRLDDSSKDLGKIMRKVDETVASINSFSKSMNTFSQNANQTLAKVDDVVSSADPAKVRTALTNFEQASTTVNRAANNVASLTETIDERKEDIDKFITDASELASRLNKASTRVDDVLAKLDGLLGSGETESIMAEARETLDSYRQLAETLNARIGPIADNLSRFSGQGLRDVQDLVQESRRAVTRIERAITSLEQNPQRIITGGEGTVRRYDGRARR